MGNIRMPQNPPPQRKKREEKTHTCMPRHRGEKSCYSFSDEGMRGTGNHYQFMSPHQKTKEKRKINSKV